MDWFLDLLIVIAWMIRLRSPAQQLGSAEAVEIRPVKVAVLNPQLEKGGR